MQVALVFVVSLFLVQGAVVEKDESKKALLAPLDSTALKKIQNRLTREVKKENIDENRARKKSFKKNTKPKPKKNAGKEKTEKENKKQRTNDRQRKSNKKTKHIKRKEKSIKGSGHEKTKLNKIKVTKRKKKTTKKSKSQNNPRQTCSSGVTSECMEAAKQVLVFEGTTAINFVKKFIRFGRQNLTIGKKLEKKGNFDAPKTNMEKAMMGDDGKSGNMSSIASCTNENSRGNFSSNFDLLSNCSALIEEECSPAPPDQTLLAGMVKCNEEISKLRDLSEACRELTTDGAGQCSCWINLKSTVDAIKALQPKCITNMDALAKAMKESKKDCTDMFSVCKRAEDASVKLINDCMNFEVQALNQTKIAEEAGSKITGFK